MPRRSFLLFRPSVAHQGGWDEALMIFGIPILLFTVMRLLAGRGKREDDERPDGRS